MTESSDQMPGWARAMEDRAEARERHLLTEITRALSETKYRPGLLPTPAAKEPLTVLSFADALDAASPRLHRDDPCVSIDRSEAPVRGEALHRVWWRGQQWAVTEHGIECLDGRYTIAGSRLREDLPGYSFPEHMAEKDWVDADEFATAWVVGLLLHGHGGRIKPEQVLAVFARLPPRG